MKITDYVSPQDFVKALCFSEARGAELKESLLDLKPFIEFFREVDMDNSTQAHILAALMVLQVAMNRVKVQ